MDIKLAVFDFDGVFTDGKLYVSESGIMKCYNSKDSYGLKLLRDKGIHTGLITAHDTPVLDKMEHILPRMDFISRGSYDKLSVLNTWTTELGISYENIAYIGDDIPDIPVLQKVGFSACPNDAVTEVKDCVKYICKNSGGNGAVREFCEFIIHT